MAPPALLIGLQGTVASLTVALALLLLPLMATMGAQGVLGVALVPQRERCAVFSIAYSLAMALFAGTSPLVASWMHAHRGAGWVTILYNRALWSPGPLAVQRSQRLLASRLG